MQIKVPATSANLGPGFDSIGIAVSLFLTVEVAEQTKTWTISHNLGPGIPANKTNLIVATALKVAPTIKPHHLKMRTDIPVTRGLGSSSSAIVAGIELANQLGDLRLTNDQKLEYACHFEGHPDNVAPAILGALVIGTNINDHFVAVKAPFPELAFVAYIPSYELKTSDSRNALPAQLDFKAAKHASSIANTFVAALLTQNFTLAGQLIEADEFHEPFRQRLVPELLPIRKIAHACGAIGTYLSGAGPTVMTILPPEKVTPFITQLAVHGFNDAVVQLNIESAGVQVIQ
ncbi:homoserine kinase [Paucilactobacillus kaifaensis]|uniref:homoserine kinase n=1 Tax=Paucilactobacillus kaifaensis TaxID=2559921 RepID=UPI0010F94011|nr:homoserine kinase [Paucilactobacillus kaifaensis]